MRVIALCSVVVAVAIAAGCTKPVVAPPSPSAAATSTASYSLSLVGFCDKLDLTVLREVMGELSVGTPPDQYTDRNAACVRANDQAFAMIALSIERYDSYAQAMAATEKLIHPLAVGYKVDPVPVPELKGRVSYGVTLRKLPTAQNWYLVEGNVRITAVVQKSYPGENAVAAGEPLLHAAMVSFSEQILSEIRR